MGWAGRGIRRGLGWVENVVLESDGLWVGLFGLGAGLMPLDFLGCGQYYDFLGCCCGNIEFEGLVD